MENLGWQESLGWLGGGLPRLRPRGMGRVTGGGDALPGAVLMIRSSVPGMQAAHYPAPGGVPRAMAINTVARAQVAPVCVGTR